jgi:hypothetical protein
MERLVGGKSRVGAPVWSLVLCACAGGIAGGGCNKGDDSAEPPCNVEITKTLPLDSSTDACFVSDIEFSIAGGDKDGEITLTDSSGNDLPGTTTSNTDGSLLVFHPNAPLTPSASYTATLTYCLGKEVVAFTTSAYGEPIVDAKGLVGNIYVVDLKNDSRFNKPQGVSTILQPQLTRKIFLEVLDPTTTTGITMRMAVAKDGSATEQDPCTPTVDFVGGHLDGPSFTIGPMDVTIPISNQPVNIGDLEAMGTFSADGSSFGCGGFSGLVDTRPLVPLIGDEGSPDDFICGLIGGYGADCIECTDGEDFCLILEVDQAIAQKTDEVTVTVITADDIKNNPACTP